MVSSSPPPVLPPWTCTWSASTDSWLFINEVTGERTYEYSYEVMNGGDAGGRGNNGSSYGYANGDIQRTLLDNASDGVARAPEGLAYDAGEAGQNVEEYKDDAEGAVEGVKDGVAGWVGDAVEAVGEKIGQGLGYVASAPESVAEEVDEGVVDVQQFGEDCGDAVVEAPEKMVEAPEKMVEAPEKMAEEVPEEVMQKAGEGVGDVQEIAEDVQRYGQSLSQAYEQGRGDERYD